MGANGLRKQSIREDGCRFKPKQILRYANDDS
jgi:hypothetical protein